MPATQAALDGASPKRTADRATRYTPAVTMVAAWIRADTGVGPSMASGNHTNSGIWALLPVAASNISIVTTTTAVLPTAHFSGANWKTWLNCKVPNPVQMNMIASASPKSPIRLTRKAFLPASAAEGFSNQNPISRYDARPTPSHPT
jgi:hypothetical protein